MTHYKSLINTGSGWKWPVNPALPLPLQPVVSNIGQTKVYIRQALAHVPEELLWRRISASVLSVGNHMLHLRGTEHQWIGNKLGGLPLRRDRDLEMSATGGIPFAKLLADLEETEAQTLDILTRLTEADLDRTYSEDNLSAEFILHYTAQHLAYHAGQLVMLRKILEPDFRLYG